MSRRPLWEEIYKRFDPELPAPAHWRAERDQSPEGEAVPVLDYQDPSRHGPGVGLLCKLYELQVEGLEGAEELVSKELLSELAYRSGGRVEGFVRFIRTLAEKAWDEDVQVATPELVNKVLDEWRRRQEVGLRKEHIQLMESIMVDPEHRLPESEIADELLDHHRLIPYHLDDSVWCYPHPLLTMRLLQAMPTDSDR
jgi:hypothetical protein